MVLSVPSTRGWVCRRRATTGCSALANWWWTVDRWLLGALSLLMVLGIVLAMAGSPAVAERLGLSTFFFVHHQIMFMIPAAMILVATSFLSPRDTRRALPIYFPARE